ncbi:MAG: alpha-amylase, partial [Bacteroidota bacterium]
NPLELDENLAEPALGLDAETEFAAFAEAVHQAGMDLVAEFVFRTASLDSDLAIKHPEWFYWIDASVENRPPDSNDPDKYGPPVFDSETLEEIKDKVNNNDFGELPQPTKIYRELFRSAPEKAERKGDKIRGYRKNQELRIPGAFADWPPDDNQPVWSDVTYLKLYDHPDYNYIAYNTVRMYDEALAREKFRQRDLWTYIQSIVPDYIDRFDIDGVMVDMGHALPEKLRSGLIAKARDRKEGFLFWEENFVLDPKSVRDGYDAAIGYLPFDEHIPYKMKELIHRIASGNCPIDFFATAESHNTPRAASRPGGVAFSKMAWTINAFLPTIQFIHSGVELGEKRPVNTGLGFTDEQIRRHPSSELPLFSAAALDWDSPDEFTEYIKCINLIREKYIKDRPNSLENGICEVGVDHDKVVAFIRRTRGEMPDLLIVANMSQDKIEHARLDPGNDYSRVKMIDESNRYEMIDGGIAIDLEAWDAKIMEILA